MRRFHGYRKHEIPVLPVLQPPRHQHLPSIRYVQIATHSRCNADCVFCPYIESAHAANHGRMTDETWNLILDNLAPWAHQLEKICPYLMQEPLLDKTIYSKIESIYERFPDVGVEISTNGAALTEDAVDKLFQRFEGRKHEIWVSHHGVNAETLLHIMQINYDNAHANLIRMLKKSDGRFRIKIRGAGKSQAVQKTYFTRDEYIRYWMEQFEKNGINTTNVSVDAFEFHDRAATLHREDRGACSLNRGKVREIGPGHQPFYCPRVDQWLHFMWDGSIRLCCMDYHHEVKLPNINDMPLVDYFQSEQYAEIVGWVSGTRESPENFICKRCTSPGG